MLPEEPISLDVALSMHPNFVDTEMLLQSSEGQTNLKITLSTDKMMPPYLRIGSYRVPIMNHSRTYVQIRLVAMCG
jgi:hypothetical protein